ncbi:MAG: hypothetical protein ACRDVG_07925 [Jatrophihabitantaceae bacterium]
MISPYARRGAVVHSYYSQLNMIRTIEQTVGLPRMNQQDLTAVPMYEAFTNEPDLAPYDHLPSQVPLTETNPAVTAHMSTAAAAWARWSARQDRSTEDTVNMAGATVTPGTPPTPYPGDSRVLLPGQVPGAGN